MSEEDGLRIDKFLWFARLTRTRSLAQKKAEKGHIRCAGRRIDRAHATVRVGDILSVPMPDSPHSSHSPSRGGRVDRTL